MFFFPEDLEVRYNHEWKGGESQHSSPIKYRLPIPEESLVFEFLVLCEEIYVFILWILYSYDSLILSFLHIVINFPKNISVCRVSQKWILITVSKYKPDSSHLTYDIITQFVFAVFWIDCPHFRTGTHQLWTFHRFFADIVANDWC